MKKLERIYYFAYGSNLSISQMKRRCPKSKLICKGILKGYKLLFNKYSYNWGGSVADVMKSPRDNVWGLIYSLTFADLKKLDIFEGFPKAYNRKLLPVFTADNRVFKEHTWVYYISYKYKEGRPVQSYLDILKDAAYNFNFPRYYKTMLKKVKVAKPVKYRKVIKKILTKAPTTREILEDDDLWVDVEGDTDDAFLASISKQGDFFYDL